MKRLFKGNRNVYTFSIISKIVFIILSFINSILINRYLGPSLKGEYAYLINLVNIIALVINLSIAQSYPYFSRKYGNEIKKIFFNIIYVQLVGYIILGLAFTPFIEDKLLIFAIFISIITQFNMQINFMSITIDINKKNFISIISSFLYTLILLFVYSTNETYLEYVIFSYVIFIIINAILLIFINKIFPSKGIIKKITIREILTFSFFPMVTSLLITLNYNIDIIILELFVEYRNIGIYSLGVTLAGMLWVIPDAFKDVLFNKTVKNNSIRDIKFAIKFNLFLSIIIILGFIILGKTFISIFYGDEFLDSYLVTVILFVGTIPMILFKMINTLYIAIGKQRLSFVILFLAVAGNVLLNFILIPIIGIEGAAISSVFSYLLSGLLMLISFVNNHEVTIRDIFLISRTDISKIKRFLRK